MPQPVQAGALRAGWGLAGGRDMGGGVGGRWAVASVERWGGPGTTVAGERCPSFNLLARAQRQLVMHAGGYQRIVQNWRCGVEWLARAQRKMTHRVPAAGESRQHGYACRVRRQRQQEPQPAQRVAQRPCRHWLMARP